MKASDLMVRCLEAEGVDTIFGVPGEENADFMISLMDSPINFVICRHEQGAAFMADVYGRLTGRPGVCLATLGPGATNLTTGVGSANMDRSPLVAIVGQASTKRLHKESHQNMDSVSMFKQITKWSNSIYDARNIPEVVHKAFKLATAEKPGATMIELPEDIAKDTVDLKPMRVPTKFRRAGPDEKAVRQALELIADAYCPVVLAGNGCVRTRASKQLGRFIDETGVFVATTFMGKGAVSDRHPQSLFTAGLGARDLIIEAFEAADLVICVGYDMVEWHPDRWNVGKPKKILHIDFEPAEVDSHYATDVEVVSDLAGALWKINDGLGPEHRKDDGRFSELRGRILAELRADDADEGFPYKPQRILADVRAVLGDEDILISDVGAHKMWVARHYETYVPNTCLITNGFCSMGIALPGAIAAKRSMPDRNVVAICGDGGFMMNVQELATAVEHDIPCTFVIWEDSQFGLIKWKQEAHFGTHVPLRFMNPDFVKLAQAFGAKGVRLDGPDQLQGALRKSFAEPDKPTVIVVPVDYDENMKLTHRLGQVISH